MPSVTRDNIETVLEDIEKLNLEELRERWRLEFRRRAPAHLSRSLLIRIMAYRLQAQVFGDLSKETARFLDRLAKQKGTGTKHSVPLPGAGRPRVGTLLVREHEGVRHTVEVTEYGFVWQGTTYASLSKVARAITGTNWNGPRFFGLRSSP